MKATWDTPLYRLIGLPIIDTNNILYMVSRAEGHLLYMNYQGAEPGSINSNSNRIMVM